ncbi:hypothetical protein O6482_25760, partial [Salmonella enterica subsp. enterica]
GAGKVVGGDKVQGQRPFTSVPLQNPPLNANVGLTHALGGGSSVARLAASNRTETKENQA